MNPKISIITVVYNDESHITETIESVIGQTYENVEYIIIDGGSTDSTLTCARKFESSITKIISEKDRGIYDAMNKGISHATGEWILFLNSGDRLADKNILEIFSNYNSVLDRSDIVYGNVSVFSEDYDVKYIMQAKHISKIQTSMVMNHQGCFIKRQLHVEMPYDLRFRIAADYYFILRSYLLGKIISQIPEVVSVISTGGLSDANRLKTFKENLKIKEELHKGVSNYSDFIKQVIYMYLIKGVKKSGSSAFFLKLYKLKYKIK